MAESSKTSKKNVKHFHVIAGLHGYMPDYNEVHRTKREARNGLKEYVARSRDAGYRYFGNLRDTWFATTKTSIIRNAYACVEECYEVDCLRGAY